MTQPLLARDIVRFVGEPVAVIVTEEPYQGEDAAELVRRGLRAAAGGGRTFEAALATAPHAAVPGGRDQRGGRPSATRPSSTADLFDGCEAVVSRTIENQRVAPAPMEARAAAAAWGDDGRLTAWIPNQGAQGTRASLAGDAGRGPGRVRIITPAVGGAFGAKFGADPETGWCAWVARELGRPGPLERDPVREPGRHDARPGAAEQQSRSAGRRDGTVLAYRLEVLQDCGAYPRIGAILPSLTILMAPGPYAIPRAEAAAVAVVTNTTPIGAYRGAGRPEATATLERAMDLFAAEIGMDPAEVRRMNLLPPFTEPHTDRVRGAVRQRRLRGRAGRRAGRGGLRRPAPRAGRRAGTAATSCAARHRPGLLRGDHRRRR